MAIKGSTRLLFPYFQSLRPWRSVHYMGMASLGLVTATMNFQGHSLTEVLQPCVSAENLKMFPIPCAVVFFAFQSLNVLNHLVDIRRRMRKPEFTQLFDSISESRWWWIGYSYGAISLIIPVLGWSLNLIDNLRIYYFIGLYYTIGYSYMTPPLRLKRWYPISTFLLAWAAIAAFFMGFYVTQTSNPVPWKVIFLILLSMTFSFGTKDRKDWQRDSESGIRTLYTIFGFDRGRMYNSLIVLLSYLLVPFIFNVMWLMIPSLLFGGGSAWVTYSVTHYREKYIFIFYFLYSAVLLGYLFAVDPTLLLLSK